MTDDKTIKKMIMCQACGKEIAKSAQSCPFCGGRNKKPIYKRGCFWAILIVGVFFTLAAICLFSGGLSSDNRVKRTAEQEELYKSECKEKEYTFEELSRSPDNYKGQKAYIKGEVIQVVSEGSSYIVLRVNITPKTYEYSDDVTWSDTIYVQYYYYDKDNRILEDDIVNIYGVLDGIKEGETIFGETVSLPKIIAEYIEQESIPVE